MRVLIVPDKFKGTLSAPAAAAALAAGWQQARPDDSLDLLPMSDGGDGFGETVSTLLGATPQVIRTTDAAHRPCRATWWWNAKTKTAVIESPKVIGLAMLPPEKFHPFALDTFGLGTVLRAASAKGAKHILVGIGGSATNDGGFGLARALGWKFRNGSGNPIERWTDLHALAEIRPPKFCRDGQVTVAVDVQNPLLGLRGATRVYGPQKGLRPGDFKPAERCLRRLARVVKRQFGKDFARVPGAGAAGGLGFGLMAFCGARMQPGFELFAKLAGLQRRLRAAGLVITGEGALDPSTLMGKGVGQVARCCRELKIPCIGLAGAVLRNREVDRLFSRVGALTDVTTLKQAKARPAFWLEFLAARLASDWPSKRCKGYFKPASCPSRSAKAE
jgi:glycerate kinase